ncbi:MAG: hypothetical protein K6C12_00830 [Oscillospiraceae bacterium]|nr:hypothetical protein [Oscillospiraceae bacterium]
MFILFHGAIFDPAEITMVQADEAGLWIQTAGAAKVTLIESEEKTAQAMLGELYQVMLEQGIACDNDDGPEIELDEDELSELKQILDDGYEYIARDKSGSIYGYRFKPTKRKSTFEDPRTPDPVRLHRDWYSEIDYDASPISITYLLLDN